MPKVEAIRFSPSDAFAVGMVMDQKFSVIMRVASAIRFLLFSY